MIDESAVAELLQAYVFIGREHLVSASSEDDVVRVTTNLQQFLVRSEADAWLIGREEWVDDLVVATRTDQHIHGQPERFAFLLADGSDVSEGSDVVYVNDASAIADLGRRLRDGLDPIAYAELLVQFHPYSSARRSLLVNSDDLETLYQVSGLPEVEPFITEESADDMIVEFSSTALYRPPGGPVLIDLYEWSVNVPTGEAATWDCELAIEGIPLIDRSEPVALG